MQDVTGNDGYTKENLMNELPRAGIPTIRFMLLLYRIWQNYMLFLGDNPASHLFIHSFILSVFLFS